jgi:hypothetical protein
MVAIPQAILAKEIAKRGSKETGEYLEKKLGYDFVNLVTKLAIFYVISFLIAKYMEAIIYASGGLSTVAGLFGIKLAQSDKLPQKWVSLFVDINQNTYSATPTAPGQFNPPGWDRPYDYGTEEHQKAEPYLFPEKDIKFKFWDLINAIAILYIGWEAYNYWNKPGKADLLTLGIFGLMITVLTVLSFSKFLNNFSLNKFQEDNK